VRIRNLSHPAHPVALETIQHVDETRTEQAKHARFLVRSENRLIGAFDLETPLSNPEPGELSVMLALVPEAQNHAERAFAFILAQASKLGGRLLRVSSQENLGLHAFWLEHGFQEFDRMWVSNLQLEHFNASPFSAALEKAKGAGLEVRHRADFADDSSFLARYYHAVIEILRDVPTATPFQPWDFETWKHRAISGPNALPEGEFIGLIRDEIVGVSQLFKSARAGAIETGLTGVRRAYRHQGIAMTLKIRAALYAKAQGFEQVRTTNHVVNRPMLSINEALGFEKEPAILQMRKPV
jgi:GNAT superfamily N-acetyltransferase